MSKLCLHCSKALANLSKNYCSLSCYRKSPTRIKRGPPTQETRDAISRGLQGRIMPEGWAVNATKHFKGVPKTASHRAKIGAAQLGVPESPEAVRRSRETKLAKNGGVNADERQTPQVYIWREAVLKKDSNTCCHCGLSNEESKNRYSRELSAHHIKSWKDFPELRFDVNNGLTLCNSCHSKEERHLQNERR